MTTSALPAGNALPPAPVLPRQASRVAPVHAENPGGKAHAPAKGSELARRSTHPTRTLQNRHNPEEHGNENAHSRNPKDATLESPHSNTEPHAARSNSSQSDQPSQEDGESQDSAHSFLGLLDREIYQQGGEADAPPSLTGQKTGKAQSAGKLPLAKRALVSLFVVPGLASDSRDQLPISFGSITPLEGKAEDPAQDSEQGQPASGFSIEPQDNTMERQQVVLSVEKAISVRIHADDSQSADTTTKTLGKLESLLPSQQKFTTSADEPVTISAGNPASPSSLLTHNPSGLDTAQIKPSTRPEKSFEISEIAETPQPTRSAQPMRDIALHLPGSGGIDIRLSERAGQIHVDVRSADPSLTQDLRGNIHDLVSGLEKKGFSTEISHPVEQHATQQLDMQSAKNHSSDSHDQGGSSDRDQQNQQQQQARLNQFANSKSRKNGERAWNETWTSNTEQ